MQIHKTHLAKQNLFDKNSSCIEFNPLPNFTQCAYFSTLLSHLQNEEDWADFCWIIRQLLIARNIQISLLFITGFEFYQAPSFNFDLRLKVTKEKSIFLSSLLNKSAYTNIYIYCMLDL